MDTSYCAIRHRQNVPKILGRAFGPPMALRQQCPLSHRGEQKKSVARLGTATDRLHLVGRENLRCSMNTDAAEFRKRAEDCLGLIPRMNADAKPILLSIAEAWLALAHEVENRRHDEISKLQ
jgi:hypothetical protein